MTNSDNLFEWNAKEKLLICHGDWTVQNLITLQHKLADLQLSDLLTISLAKLKRLDTAGVWLLFDLLKKSQLSLDSIIDVEPKQRDLLQLIQEQQNKLDKTQVSKTTPWLARWGKRSVSGVQQLLEFFNLVGASCLVFWQWVCSPKRILWQQIFITIETAGYQAITIIGLLSFLIGVVLTYQMGLQLRDYGGNIFIVNLLGLAILREFAPLMTAILIAGRSGSAFTAQIGTMQVNEELDALRTMGVSPIEQLVLPKIFGLSIALPLLTIWSSMLGIFGGMVMSKHMLSIGYYDFLVRFQEVIPIKTFIIGLAKAPVFAIIIALIGCLQGFRVKGSADSVGRQTTQSVVQAIFLIICTDAGFSILLSWYNL